jgi:hypothetical protein
VIVYTKNDTSPDLIFLLEADGEPLPDLDDATVVFKLRKPSGAIVARTLTCTNLLTARVEGAFAAGDLDESSDEPMPAELVVTYASGRVQHSEEPLEVWVRDEYTEVVS